MITTDTYEADAAITPLLERVRDGRRVIITSAGRPVAVLLSTLNEKTDDLAKLGRDMLAFRARVKRNLGGTFRESAHAGHRY
jgi:prevent-host-death family protein